MNFFYSKMKRGDQNQDGSGCACIYSAYERVIAVGSEGKILKRIIRYGAKLRWVVNSCRYLCSLWI